MLVQSATSARVPLLRKLIELACERDARRRQVKERATELEIA